ncbi:MAG: hypothetical protein ACE5JS_17630 [Nitrospinota bacterium]
MGEEGFDERGDERKPPSGKTRGVAWLYILVGAWSLYHLILYWMDYRGDPP